MKSLETTLLENLLDSLDRLFDRENQVADVHDILVATAAALDDTAHIETLRDAINKTNAILRAGLIPEKRRDAALAETDDLRKYLSESVYKDRPLRI